MTLNEMRGLLVHYRQVYETQMRVTYRMHMYVSICCTHNVLQFK